MTPDIRSILIQGRDKARQAEQDAADRLQRMQKQAERNLLASRRDAGKALALLLPVEGVWVETKRGFRGRLVVRYDPGTLPNVSDEKALFTLLTTRQHDSSGPTVRVWRHGQTTDDGRPADVHQTPLIEIHTGLCAERVFRVYRSHDVGVWGLKFDTTDQYEVKDESSKDCKTAEEAAEWVATKLAPYVVDVPDAPPPPPRPSNEPPTRTLDL